MLVWAELSSGSQPGWQELRRGRTCSRLSVLNYKWRHLHFTMRATQQVELWSSPNLEFFPPRTQCTTSSSWMDQVQWANVILMSLQLQMNSVRLNCSQETQWLLLRCHFFHSYSSSGFDSGVCRGETTRILEESKSFCFYSRWRTLASRLLTFSWSGITSGDGSLPLSSEISFKVIGRGEEINIWVVMMIL